MTREYHSALNHARSELESARQLLQIEISGYPAPISGCDAQFNHLLAERSRIAGALASLNEQVFIPTPRSPSPTAGVESR